MITVMTMIRFAYFISAACIYNCLSLYALNAAATVLIPPTQIVCYWLAILLLYFHEVRSEVTIAMAQQRTKQPWHIYYIHHVTTANTPYIATATSAPSWRGCREGPLRRWLSWQAACYWPNWRQEGPNLLHDFYGGFRHPFCDCSPPCSHSGPHEKNN